MLAPYGPGASDPTHPAGRGLKVTVIDTDTGQTATVTTDAAGRYRFANLAVPVARRLAHALPFQDSLDEGAVEIKNTTGIVGIRKLGNNAGDVRVNQLNPSVTTLNLTTSPDHNHLFIEGSIVPTNGSIPTGTKLVVRATLVSANSSEAFGGHVDGTAAGSYRIELVAGARSLGRALPTQPGANNALQGGTLTVTLLENGALVDQERVALDTTEPLDAWTTLHVQALHG